MLITRLTAIAVMAITIVAFPHSQPAVRQPQPTGPARLTGRVVAADDGKPVRRASVSLSGLPDSQRKAGANRVYVARLVETDLDGRFDVADLPAGWYTISVDPVNGFVRPVRSREATLPEGRTTEITFRLERTGAIEGRIHDENGDPVLGAEVHAVRRLDFFGHTELATGGASAATDDRGNFRLFGLRPGEYYVLATYTDSELRSAPPRRSGYANTYYPGALTLQAAKPIKVEAGRDSGRLVFGLVPCRLATVTIHAVDSHGVVFKDASVTLTRKDDIYLRSFTRSVRREENGAHIIHRVPPGNYYVMVSRAAQPSQEAAYAYVSIDGQDVSLTVRTNAGARLSGRILIDGQPASAHAQTRNVTVSAFPPPRIYGPTFPMVPVAEGRGTDRFTLTGLRGRVRVYGDVAAGALLSIRRGQEEIAGKTLEFTGTETIDDVVVSLTTNVAQLDVSVIGTGVEPAPVLVILFPDDPARWRPGYLAYARMTASPASDRRKDTASAQPPASYRTRLTRRPAGRYLIVAIDDVESEYFEDVRVFEQLRRFATPVTLVAGQTPSVTIGVSKPPR